jgi:hypothetical protein
MSWGGAALVCGAAKRGTSLHTPAAPERTKAGAFPCGWVEPATNRRCRAHPLSGHAFAGASNPGVASANPFVSRERGVRWHRSSEISLAGSAPRSRAAQLIKLRQSASFGPIWTETTDRRHRVPPPAGLNAFKVSSRLCPRIGAWHSFPNFRSTRAPTISIVSGFRLGQLGWKTFASLRST